MKKNYRTIGISVDLLITKQKMVRILFRGQGFFNSVTPEIEILPVSG